MGNGTRPTAHKDFIHCTRCDFDVHTNGYGQHLFDHVRGIHADSNYEQQGLRKHKINDDAECLAKFRGYTGKHPEFKGQRKRERAARLIAQKQEEARRQEETRKKKEAERQEQAAQQAKELSKAVATARSQGTPYSALIGKGKKWKGRKPHIISGGLPGSRR
jgi:hypothetical protein